MLLVGVVALAAGAGGGHALGRRAQPRAERSSSASRVTVRGSLSAASDSVPPGPAGNCPRNTDHAGQVALVFLDERSGTILATTTTGDGPLAWYFPEPGVLAAGRGILPGTPPTAPR